MNIRLTWSLFLCIIGCYNMSYSHPFFPTDPNIRKSSYPFISGDTFRLFCDHIFDETDVQFNAQRVQPGDTVFCALEMMPQFFSQQHTAIQHPYILVTHNNDHPAPGAFKSYVDDPKIIAWFTQNMDMTHEKIFPLPIGLANYHWPHGKTEIVKAVMQSTPPLEHRNGFYAYFNFVVGTNKAARQPIWNLFVNKPFCKIAQKRSYQNYLQDMKLCKFVISPPGNGLDCHRHWEALLMGCIPIMKHSSIDPLFEDLPIILVDDWDQVTEDFLRKQYENIQSRTCNVKKLYAEYWFDTIRHIQNMWRKTNHLNQ